MRAGFLAVVLLSSALLVEGRTKIVTREHDVNQTDFGEKPSKCESELVKCEKTVIKLDTEITTLKPKIEKLKIADIESMNTRRELERDIRTLKFIIENPGKDVPFDPLAIGCYGGGSSGTRVEMQSYASSCRDKLSSCSKKVKSARKELRPLRKQFVKLTKVVTTKELKNMELTKTREQLKELIQQITHNSEQNNVETLSAITRYGETA